MAKIKKSHVCGSMTVYVSKADESEKSGNNVKLVLHCSPVVGNTVFTSRTIPFEMWPHDPQLINEIKHTIDVKKMKPVVVSNKTLGYLLEGDDVPEQFRNCYAELGYKLESKVIWFKDLDAEDPIRKKVDRNMHVVNRANGEPIKSDHAMLTWFDGAEGESEELTREYRYNEFLRTWISARIPTTTGGDDEEVQDVGQD